ncbi:relaxase/mobilization nuclease domain-containing protein [Brevundimonas alba]|uniref:relaxase/mobilization nuclease domain-containing protein n=1 Tax=Brevundimonas alba TaxID=74314 RepID=UPI00315875EF
MTDFRSSRGFEEVLRPPVDIRRARITPAVLRPARGGGGDPSARFARVARRAPEVMVKITGRTRDGAHLKAHLNYVSRNGALALEGPDGERLEGRGQVRDLARDWAEEFALEPGRRRDASISLSIVLSMPAGTDAVRLQDAARAFAAETFGERFRYVFALHDEGRHPHVHLTVRRLGQDGERLNPRKADLQAWREGFARALRDRAIEAEATPRRTRCVARKAERLPVRKMRERFAAGQGPLPAVLAVAYRAALTTDGGEAPWLEAIRTREVGIRRVLVAEALRLSRSERPGDRALAALVERFVRERPAAITRDQALRQRGETQRDPGRTRER